MTALATVVAFQTYEVTGNPLALGLLGLVEAIPALGLMLVGGHVADRRDRRSIILVTGSLLVVGALALAVALARPGRVGPAGDPRRRLPHRRGGRLRAAGPDGLRGPGHPDRARHRGRLVPGQRVDGRGQSSGRPPAASRSPSSASRRRTPVIAVLLAISTVCVALIAPQADARRRRPARACVESLAGGVRYVVDNQVAAGLDGARPVRGVLRRRHRAAAGLRERHPPRRPGRAGPAADRAVGGRAAGDAGHDALPADAAGRADLPLCVAIFGVSMLVFGLSTILRRCRWPRCS